MKSEPCRLSVEQNLVPLSGRDVALPLTVTDKEKLLVLGAILQGLIENVMSGDVVWLSVYRAQQICVGMGMDEEVFVDTANEFMRIAQEARKKNPIHKMF